MFSQKKSFFKRKLFYVVLASLLGAGYLVNNMPAQLPGEQDVSANINQPVDKTEPVKNQQSNSQSQDSNPYNNPNQQPSEPTGTSSDTAISTETEGYYLVQEVDGIIKVFYCQNGEKQLYQETDIAFSLIGEEDQQMFSKGIILNSEEELQNLLQDFES